MLPGTSVRVAPLSIANDLVAEDYLNQMLSEMSSCVPFSL
jgi:hypothetical protein